MAPRAAAAGKHGGVGSPHSSLQHGFSAIDITEGKHFRDLNNTYERILTRGRMPTFGDFGRLALSPGRSTFLSLMDRLAGPGQD